MKKHSVDLSILLPTFNEERNITIIVNEIVNCFSKTNINYQIIICDGCSNDNTINESLVLKNKFSYIDIIVLKSSIRKDITKSVLSGIDLSFGNYIAVMDCDGQHQVSDLFEMFNKISDDDKDLIVGSRNLNHLDNKIINPKRKYISKLINKLLNFFFKFKLSDPLSGFFIINKKLINPKIFINEISGFKVLFHLIVNSDKSKTIIDYPIDFKKRKYGKSKLDIKVGYYFLVQFITYLLPINMPFKFVSFLIIGSIGAILHMTVFYITFQTYSIFYVSHLLALFFASVFNFILNNYLTFSDFKLVGKKNILNGILIYILISLITISGSTLISSNIFYIGFSAYLATIVGALIDSVFKYITVQKFVWKK